MLSLVEPGQSTWHTQLPRIRKLTEEALREVEGAGDAEIASRLVELLGFIDEEIEAGDENVL